MTSSTTTDSPILLIGQIERLKEVAPHRVDWGFDQTEAESKARRSETKRINPMIFAERIAGLVFALLVALLGVGSAVCCASTDREITGSIIDGATLAGLVTAFIAGRKASGPP